MQEFRYCDTQFQGMTEYERLQAERTTPLPERGAEGWPSLRLENRAYRNRVFRKLHLELALRQDGLQVQFSPVCELSAACVCRVGWPGRCTSRKHALACISVCGFLVMVQNEASPPAPLHRLQGKM